MKKLTVILLSGILFSCNNNGTATKDVAKDSASGSATVASNPAYPYTIKHPDFWEIGSSANTLAALSGLKAWEEGKMGESVKYFADSVHVQFDGLDKKLSNDSLKSMFTSSWNNYKSVQVRMEDWESVISKDKSQEWVTLWYTQIWETKAGVKDSSAIINDLQLKNGKIVRLDEYTRKLH